MIKNRKSPLVYFPKTMNELLNLYKSMPECRIFSGGTGIMAPHPEKYPLLDRSLITLARIEDLKSVRRTEGYLEIGACATINKIISIGEHVLRPALFKALRNIGTEEVRNLATLGGNICSPGRTKTLFPLLILLDVRVELRKQGSVRWVPVAKFSHGGENGLLPGEVLTRIRIPFNNLNYQFFAVSGDFRTDYENAMTFCCLASVQKEILTEIRFSAGVGSEGIFRSREFEDALSGRKLPVFGITGDPAYSRFSAALKGFSPSISQFRQQQIDGMFQSFLHHLNDMI